MQLDKLIIETRPRSAWSAIDLGMRLGRRFWLRSFSLYIVLALPIYGLTLLLGSDVSSMLPYIIFWMCKPVFERPILHLMSRELFAEPMSVKRVFADIRSWLTPSFFWIITWRRFSIYRGMTAPIMLLERPKGSAYTKRAGVLVSKSSSQALWLNVVFYHVESFLLLGGFALLGFMYPDAAIGAYEQASTGYNSVVLNAVYLLIMAGIAPFYAAAGFMLYICRRVELEGWDIEIVFRNWMSNYKAPQAQALPTSEDAIISSNDPANENNAGEAVKDASDERADSEAER